MRVNYRREFSKHLENHHLSYFFILVLFLMGLIFGAIIVLTMHFTQKQDLLFYLNQYFGRIEDSMIGSPFDLLKMSIVNHIQYLAIFFVLGLSIIGLPAIWIMVFAKGTFIGFSVGFFVSQYGARGFAFVSAALLPQNFIIIPVYLLAGTLAMICSLYLLKRLTGRRLARMSFQPMLHYSSIFILLTVCLVLAAFVEAYFSSYLIRYLTSSFSL
ncbi:stage II sporulation protein M [Amphibacillus sediminis]|uniref:stage II sporulation protein M n=1 Tax=Amphibacillus sediminis TaxID=360185 RepID=UPI000835B693|nr:stage II sporulation protein M [Amphibacillus sediminis]